MIGLLIATGYLFGAGAGVKIYLDKVDEHWLDHPEIMFIAILWAVAVPFILGWKTIDAISPTSRNARAIAKAEHKAEIKRIEANALRELEREAGIH